MSLSPQFYVQVTAILRSRRLVFPPEKDAHVKIVAGSMARAQGENAALQKIRTVSSIDEVDEAWSSIRSTALQVEDIQRETKSDQPPATPKIRRAKPRKTHKPRQMSAERMLNVLSLKGSDPKNQELKRQVLVQLRREFAWMRRVEPDAHKMLRMLELRYLSPKGIQDHTEVARAIRLSETNVRLLELEGFELLKGYLGTAKAA
ncbi:hypothetical protein J4450_01510 [Candidatus Micrarchaeota archaeon]|nr:hypothetical protein [Candidatus Micrarchaeota archaeon]